MPEDLPKVTALLPSYNAAEFIGDTLASLAAQTWPNLEILIADDCSTDGTREIIRAFAAKLPNVRVIENETNLGWLGNCNEMMKVAGGEYLFFAFHDDTVSPTYVEALTRPLMANPAAVLAFCDTAIIHVGGRESIARFTDLNGLTSAAERGRIMAAKPGSGWVPNRGVFRARTAAEVGYIPRHKSGELIGDWLWLLALSLRGEFIHVPEVLCRKYFKETSLSRNWKHSPRKYWHIWLRARELINAAPMTVAEKRGVTRQAGLSMLKRAINLRLLRSGRKNKQKS